MKIDAAKFNQLREIDADSLPPGHQTFHPGLGVAHLTDGKGEIKLHMGWMDEIDGTSWEILDRTGSTITAHREDGLVLEALIRKGDMILVLSGEDNDG